MSKATVGLCTLELDLGGVDSLKLKRSIIKSLLARLRNEFNVAAAEIADQDDLERAVIAVAAVSNSNAHANSIMDNIIDWIEENWRDGDIADQQIEIL
ncbi:MAG: DUF503 domain-containing protein [Chloroflexota bacterium]|jgi:hypothetical protein|nr:DUF503 domain-containing protein [Chloroflexota bacterium]